MGIEKSKPAATLEVLPAPTAWPNANARLLGLGVGLPIDALDRLAQFSAKEFERFTLEWAEGYLKSRLADVHEVQQRGGAGDKGRDIVVWLDPPSLAPRRCRIYQCKHYGVALGPGPAAGEIAKLLYYTLAGEQPVPELYAFVTHKGVTGTLQDLLDAPEDLKAFVLANWASHCADAVSSRFTFALTPQVQAHIAAFDFSIFRAKQPLELLNEHAQTRYHLTVFGAPLVERPPTQTPPSSVAPLETAYIAQLYELIGQKLNLVVSKPEDVPREEGLRVLFDRSRITFYCAEGLKELARDQMADQQFFTTLLDEFTDGLFYTYTAAGQTGHQRLLETIKHSQNLQLGAHVLAPHVQAKDREGMCHHMANEDRLHWCAP
ncbi:ABC-three component system protein [Caulobacter sp.]|uniref:ABC-three component system protein n=1 Tax=Caulobacter sp. TaxID=78 RepID=UPI0031DFBB17